jgi:hypothetical protein
MVRSLLTATQRMSMNKIAIIGTAGRDKTKPMSKALWEWMLADARKRIPLNSHLVSGGAAWADHVAVALFLEGHASTLTLHLPAPLSPERFIGPRGSSASAANYYHQLFSNTIGENTIQQVYTCCTKENCDGSFEEAVPGYGGMFARNLKVARDCDFGMLAYTFGEGAVPADGGTKDTWDKATCEPSRKVHVSLPIFL